jgi:hypothetical protein
MTRARDLASGLAGVRPFATAAGTTTAIVAANTYYTITLPSGRFTQAPIVTATSNNPTTYGQTIVVAPPSTTSFLIASNAASNSTAWVATQMNSGSASG